MNLGDDFLQYGHCFFAMTPGAEGDATFGRGGGRLDGTWSLGSLSSQPRAWISADNRGEQHKNALRRRKTEFNAMQVHKPLYSRGLPHGLQQESPHYLEVHIGLIAEKP